MDKPHSRARGIVLQQIPHEDFISFSRLLAGIVLLLRVSCSGETRVSTDVSNCWASQSGLDIKSHLTSILSFSSLP